MVFSTGAIIDFNNVVKDIGNTVRFRYFNMAYPGGGSGYDDDLTLTVSGNSWVSGVLQPIDGEGGGTDRLLLEQGRILKNDKKLYVAGTVETSGLWRVGIGSPAGLEYSVVEDGVIPWETDGVIVYKKVYIRHLPTGSLAEE